MSIEDVAIQRAFSLPPDENRSVQTILSPEGSDAYRFQVFSAQWDRATGESSWTLHASGKLVAKPSGNADPLDVSAVRSKCSEELAVDHYYQRCRQLGIDYGPSFQALMELRRGKGEALGKLQLPETLASSSDEYLLHPVLLDAGFQVLGAALLDGPAAGESVWLPVGLERMRTFCRPGSALWSHARTRSGGSDSARITVDVDLFTRAGEKVACIEGLRLERVSRNKLLGDEAFIDDWLYQVEWRPQTRQGRQLPPDFLPSPEGLSRELALQAGQLANEIDLGRYRQLLALLESLSAVYVLQALGEMQFGLAPGMRFSTESAAERLGVAEKHRRLLGRLFEILAEEEVLCASGDQWEVSREPDVVRTPPVQQACLAWRTH
jgi:acyl transferase domain-containing protein